MRYTLLILLLLIVGCRSSKTVSTEKERIFVQKNVILPTSNELSISNICDTLTLKAKDFKTSVNRGGVKTNIEIKDNKLSITSETPEIVYKDSIVEREIKVTKTVTKKEHHYKLAVWCFIIGGLLGWFKNLWTPFIGRLISKLF